MKCKDCDFCVTASSCVEVFEECSHPNVPDTDFCDIEDLNNPPEWCPLNRKESSKHLETLK